MAERDPIEGAYVFVCVCMYRNVYACNYFKDHMAERVGLEFGQVFCEWLREIPLKVRVFVCVCMYV